MTINNKVGTRKRKVNSELQNPVCGVSYDDMKTFLRNFGKSRLELLNYLRRCGPSSVEEIATRLHQRKESVVYDLTDLIADNWVGIGPNGLCHVAWKAINAEVQHKNRCPAQNVRNLADWHLILASRKFDWLKVKIKLRVIEKGAHTFSCSLLPTYK